MSIQRDITARKIIEQQNYDLAFLDPLTSLPNRRLFFDRLRQTIVKNTRSNQYAALLYIDLDHFKLVNDREGHAAGDRLLQAVAKRLERCLRAGDTLSRLGGDEYIVLLDQLGDDYEVATSIVEGVAHRMLSSPDTLLKENTFKWVGTFSIGVTIFSGNHTYTLEELVEQSDSAMYQAKALGRNRLQVYDQARRIARKVRELKAYAKRSTGTGSNSTFNRNVTNMATSLDLKRCCASNIRLTA